MKKGDPSISVVTFIGRIDLKGLPTPIINIVAERQPLVIFKMAKYFDSQEQKKQIL
jgi:hypothetical protein